MGVYRLSHRAKLDVEEIAREVSRHSPAAADRVLDALYDAFVSLAISPASGTQRADLRPNLRVFSPPRPAHNYVIFFYPVSGGIEISDVLHGAQDWTGIFARGDR